MIDWSTIFLLRRYRACSNSVTSRPCRMKAALIGHSELRFGLGTRKVTTASQPESCVIVGWRLVA